jgi:hypothetical protein
LTRNRLNGYSSQRGNDEVGSPLGQVFAELLRRLGCEPQITVLSLPVTYASMKNRDIDVFPSDNPFQKGQRRG